VKNSVDLMRVIDRFHLIFGKIHFYLLNKMNFLSKISLYLGHFNQILRIICAAKFFYELMTF